MRSLKRTEFLALNQKHYSINQPTLNEFNEINIKSKKTLKGVSKVVVKKEINRDDYVNDIETNEALKKEVVSIRSVNHQLYTFKQQKKPDTVLLQDANDLQHKLHPIWPYPINGNPTRRTRTSCRTRRGRAI